MSDLQCCWIVVHCFQSFQLLFIFYFFLVLFVGYSRSTYSVFFDAIEEDQSAGSFNSDIKHILELIWAYDNLRFIVIDKDVEPDGQQFRNGLQALDDYILVVQSKLLSDKQQLGRNDWFRLVTYGKGSRAPLGKLDEGRHIVLHYCFKLHSLELFSPIAVNLGHHQLKTREIARVIEGAWSKQQAWLFSFFNFRSRLSCYVDGVFWRHPWFDLFSFRSKLHFALRVTTLLHFRVLLLLNSFRWSFAAFSFLGISNKTSLPKCQHSLTVRSYLLLGPGGSRFWRRTIVEAFDFARIGRLDIGLFRSCWFHFYVVLVFHKRCLVFVNLFGQVVNYILQCFYLFARTAIAFLAKARLYGISLSWWYFVVIWFLNNKLIKKVFLAHFYVFVHLRHCSGLLESLVLWLDSFAFFNLRNFGIFRHNVFIWIFGNLVVAVVLVLGFDELTKFNYLTFFVFSRVGPFVVFVRIKYFHLHEGVV